MDGARTSISWS